jgi:hypothetical protein
LEVVCPFFSFFEWEITMSSVCVLTPIVISAWPGIVAAAVGAAQTLGLTIAIERHVDSVANVHGTPKVDIEIDNSEVLLEQLSEQAELKLYASDGITLTVSRDERGMLRVCAEGEEVSKARLKQVGEELAGRIVQQFAYNRLMNELKEHNFQVVENRVTTDSSIHVTVRTQN